MRHWPLKEILMKFISLFSMFFLLYSTAICQFGQVATEDLITISKKSAVPIWARDSSWPPDSAQFGSAVIVGDAGHIYALTCEHVVALKDSNQKTLRYLQQLFVGLNRQDDSTILVPIRLDSSNEANDFALLKVPDAIQQYPVNLKIIPLSQWATKSDLKEGNSVVFIGYPLTLGVGAKNEPLSRTAIVSQLSEHKPYFIIDGFVQHGHSGSPVFIAKPNGNEWTRYLVGIARGFPNEYAPVLQQVALRQEGGRVVILNPGFSFITSTDAILPAIRKLITSNKH